MRAEADPGTNSQPTGDISDKPGSRLSLLSTRLTVAY